MAVNKDRLPAVEDTINSENGASYHLIKTLGEGGYGMVFQAKCVKLNRLFALKAEKYSETVLKIEIGVLKIANMRHCKHICEMFDHGEVRPEFMFVVMTLLGLDLYKLKNDLPGRHFSRGTATRIAMQSMNAIEELHGCGFISRDIKPGNFAFGHKNSHSDRNLFIFDFGLARRYVDRNINIIPSRGEMGWRGTTRYGSLHAHQKADLSRRDDVESWLYMIVEITKGALPWRLITNRDLAKEAKEVIRFNDSARDEFFKDCPEKYREFLTIIDQLNFESAPPYQQFYCSLSEIMNENEVTMSSKYDWEVPDGKSANSSSTSGKSAEPSPPKTQNACNEGEDRPSHPNLLI